MSDLYIEEIIEEAQAPQGYGPMPDAECTLDGKNASCGDEVTIFLKFEKKGDTSSPIADIRWEGQGCVISRAAMSAVVRIIREKKTTLKQLTELGDADLEEYLGLPQMSIGRIKCLMLGLRTLKTAL